MPIYPLKSNPINKIIMLSTIPSPQSPMKPIQITFPLAPISPQFQSFNATNLRILCHHSCRPGRCRPLVLVKCCAGSVGDGNGGGVRARRDPVGGLQGMISSPPSAVSVMGINIDLKIAVGLCFASVVFLVVAARRIMLEKHTRNYQGSVADLVRRGQLRPDRRSISKPLKYEDPFNNPLVKAGKSNSTIEMCGKVYRMAQVTLTKEEQSIHQKRRSRAYQWKRPTTFLKEGDSVPPDVDPDTIKWIPANHPFATTVSDIDESLAQDNVNQKDGVPFRVRAEHEAMQKKLEALQDGQNLNKLEIDPGLIKDFERPFKPSSKALESSESSTSPDQKSVLSSSKSDQDADSSDSPNVAT